MGWAIDKLVQSHLDQLSTKAIVEIDAPVIGKIFVRPVVNAAKTIEIESLRVKGDLAGYILMTLVHHCVDGDENPIIQKAERLTLLQESNYETIAAIYNMVRDVIDDNGVDVKKL